MLNSDTKRHIDAARDVLVGVAPNPTTQIDQITYALIYKFMDDMDQASVKAGGEASFFIGELKKYSWNNLMSTRVGSQEKMIMYSEALAKFSVAKQLPELFRTIFNGAALPYRSPETLVLFLKEISFFDYTHPEELGNAYEYLLSIMSSQGDAGQFRTPRHIIDFIVDVMNPTKDDKVLDPACGTAGFLISSYNHILKQHVGKDDPKKRKKPLTPDERKKLMSNLQGYDIDPTMVRIAQVNMYLHQFKNPQIFQYDSLTSEERWNDKYDVILANPPFMSPKGGIKPHNKFSVVSNRAEVLFVDYIINHLKPKGRAGIIVPEGILTQSGNAYKVLRKNLVENGLYAVVSLPGGVFKPYSGVKTSILLIDNELSKEKNEVAFLKIIADGFDLGATKRPVSENDLPDAMNFLSTWRNGKNTENPLVNFVSKDQLSANGDYNLSSDRYKTGVDYSNAKWPIIRLSEFTEISAGNSAPQDEKSFENGKYPFFRTSDVGAVHLSANLIEVKDYLNDSAVSGMKLYAKGTILFPKSGASTFLNHRVIMGVDGYVASHLGTINVNPEYALNKFVYFMLTRIDAKNLTTDQTYPSLKLEEIGKIEIPLPPLDVQEQIVGELDGYAAIIAGARQLVDNWKPTINVDPEWQNVELGKICRTLTPPKKILSSQVKDFGKYKVIDQSQKSFAGWTSDESALVNPGRGLLIFGDHTCVTKFVNEQFAQGADGIKILEFDETVLPKYVFYFLQAIPIESDGYKRHFIKFKERKIPLPSLEVQERIIKEIELEQEIIDSSNKLIKIYERRIQKAISLVWNEVEEVE